MINYKQCRGRRSRRPEKNNEQTLCKRVRAGLVSAPKNLYTKIRADTGAAPTKLYKEPHMNKITFPKIGINLNINKIAFSIGNIDI